MQGPTCSRAADINNIWCETHLLEYRQQFVLARDEGLVFAVHQVEELGRLVGRRHRQYVKYHATPAGVLQLFDERLDLRHKIRDVRGEQDIAFDVFRLHPSVLDSLRVAYPRLVGGSAEFGHHSGRGLDVDHLAAAACHRQRVAARTAADINEDVIRTEKRR